MQIVSLEGIWKLRGEFLDMTAARYQEVLSRADEKLVIWQNSTGHVFPLRTGFIDAHVPCDVITPLVENGVIEEPLLKQNTEKSIWTRDLSWWFIRTVSCDAELLAHEEVRLCIEMLDYKADILINGMPVGEHRNAFVPFCEDVKRFLKTGDNQIIIRLTSGIEDHYNRDSLSFYCASPHAIHDQRIYLRKPQFTYGWDWCMPVPTCGIGRGIYLEGVSGAKITAFRGDTICCTADRAELDLFFELDNVRMYSADDAVLRYAVKYCGETVASGEKELYLTGGLNFMHEHVSLEKPALWWPNGYGEQNLYTVEAKLICRGETNCMGPKRIGIRTLEVRHDRLPDGSREYKFVVNGVRIWCKGGNWVPTDSVYLRTPNETYKTLVEEAKAANFTMLRMWGGGTYEPDCFYELCSENGILLMHDFMYACAFYPDHLDWFLHEASKEADYQTKRLAHYPCMAIWTGNNEIHESYTDWFPEEVRPYRVYGAKIFNYIQPSMVAKNAPMTAYAPSSPFFAEKANNQEAGDSHVWKWLGRNEETKMKFHYELEAFDRLTTRFSSEYGFYGALMRSSVDRFHDGEPVERGAGIWTHHGENERKQNLIHESIDRHLTDTVGLDADGYLLYSGIMQGLLYQDMTLALRAKPYCAGQLIWMYNDCWPETGWTIIDYYLTRKISFYFLKRAYAPTKLILQVGDRKAVLTVANETPQAYELELVYGYCSFDGGMEESGRVRYTAEAHSWEQPVVFDATGDLRSGFYYVKTDETIFAAATNVRPYFRDLVLPEGRAEIIRTEEQGDDLLVTIRAENYVPVACLLFSDDRTKTCDNYFPLLPGEEKTVRVYGCKEKPRLIMAAMSYTDAH